MSLLSEKIANQRLTMDAQNRTHSLDEFRSTVNYVNTTNKGYVRFTTKGGNGGLAIEKFNNVIDMPLSWRTNVSSSHNRAIRQALERSLNPYLEYLDAGKKGKLLDIVLRSKNGNGERVDLDKALSRLEVKSAFDAFDKEYNTATGRHDIVKNLIQKLMATSGHDTLDVEVFWKEYLQGDKYGLPLTSLHEYLSMKPAEKLQELREAQRAQGGGDEIPRNQQMLKTDKEFLAFLGEIKQHADEAKLRREMEINCKNIARELVKRNGAAFGDPVQHNAAIATIRSSLATLMNKEHIADVNIGADHAGMPGLDAFIKIILPAMIRHAGETALDLADLNDDASIDSVLDSTLNVTSIFNALKEFLDGAQKAADKVQMAELPNGNIALQDLMANMDAISSFACRIEVRNLFGKPADDIQFRERGLKQSMQNQIQQQLTLPIAREVAIDNHAIEYAKKNFCQGMVPEMKKVEVDKNGMPVDGGIIKKAADAVSNIKIAAELNWGVTGNDKSVNVEVKNKQRLVYAESGEKLMYEMETRAAKLTNGVKGGIKLYQRLLAGPVANMLNAKIADAKAGGVEAKLNIGEESYQAFEDQMRAARDAWARFVNGEIDNIIMADEARFTSHVNRLYQKGNITADERQNLLSDYKDRMWKAGTLAIDRFFFEKTPFPLPASGKVEDMAETAHKMLLDLFQETRADARNELKERIAVMVIQKKAPIQYRNWFSDLQARLKECRDALDQGNYKLKGDVDDAVFKTALVKVWYDAVAARFADHKVDFGDTDWEDFTRRTMSQFIADAKKLIKNYNAAVDRIDANIQTEFSNAVDTELFGHKSFSYYKKELDKKEYDAMCADVTKDFKFQKKQDIEAMKRRILEHPGAFTKSDFTDEKIISEMLSTFDKDYNKYSPKNRNLLYSEIARTRQTSVEDWIVRPTGADGKTDLHTDLTANFTRRLKDLNMVNGKVDPKNDNSKIVEAAKDIPARERNVIIDTAINEVLGKARRYAISYACGGREAFLARVEREVRERVDARIQGYAKFRREFKPLAEAILERYPAFGKATLKNKLDSVLLEQCRQSTFPKASSFAVAFEGRLKKSLDEHITMQEEEFTAYWKKIEAIYDKCVTAFNQKVASMEDELRAAGATEEDLAYMRTKLLPAMRSQLDADIQRKPESYARVEGDGKVDYGVRLARAKAELVVTEMKNALGKLKITTNAEGHITDAEGVSDLLYYTIGFRPLAREDAASQIVKNAIEKWLKVPGSADLVAAARQGAMTLAAYGSTAVGTEVTLAKASLQTFTNAMRHLLIGVSADFLQKEFKEDQVAPAMELFKYWLASYNLPTNLKVQVAGAGDDTVENHAIRHFTKHLAEVMQKIVTSRMENANLAPNAAELHEDEVLLSAEYIQGFVKFINGVSLAAIFANKQEEMIRAYRDKIVSSRPDLYDPFDVSTMPEGLSAKQMQERMTVKQMNYYGLTKLLFNVCEKAKDSLSRKITSMEDLARMGTDENVKDEFEKAYDESIDELVAFEKSAKNRVDMMAVIDTEADDTHVDALVKDVLKETAFFGQDILEPGVLSDDFHKKHDGDLNIFIDAVKSLSRTMVGDKVRALKLTAFTVPGPGGIPVTLPVNGVDDGKGGKVNELTDAFKTSVRAVVDSLSKNKNDIYGKMFDAIKKDLAATKARNEKARAKDEARERRVEHDYAVGDGTLADAVDMYGDDYADQIRSLNDM